MSKRKAPLFLKTCIVCGQQYTGYDYRTTCGNDDCLESNKHGIRPFADALVEEEPIEELSIFSESDLINELNKRGFAVDARPLENVFFLSTDISHLYKDMYRFAIVSDTHIGSVYQQMTYLHTAYDICDDKGIDDIFHGGDLVEGNGKQYRGQQHEMFLTSTDAKVAYTVQNYPKKKGKKTKLIGGSHDYVFLKDYGYDILAHICEQRDDLEYCGYFQTEFVMRDFVIALVHGNGGWTYARSYKLEKWIDRQNKKTLPDMVLMGHYHHSAYLPNCRGTEAFMLPCFQGLTPYLEEKSLYPTIGFIIITMKQLDNTGIWAINPEFIVFKEEIEEDY